MVWAHRIMGAVAVTMTILWLCGLKTTLSYIPERGPSIFVTRTCFRLSYIELPPGILEGYDDYHAKRIKESQYHAMFELRDINNNILHLPSYKISPLYKGRSARRYQLLIPHWLTNLVAWSIFFLLWRRSRKPPKGHCQQCGYNLSGNESGRCPECDHRVEPTVDTA